METSPLKGTAKILVAFAMMLPAVLCIGFASAQETDEKPGEESFLRFIEIGGVAEFTVSRKQSSEGETSTSTAAEQLEMGVGIEPHPWIGSEFGWIHEHEEDHGEEEEGHELGIFTGTIIVGPPDGSWWLKGGVQFLPFTMFELAEVHAAHDASIGPFETGAIIDPLSFEFGSKREKSLLLGVSLGEFLGSVYGYYGDDARSDEPRSGFGAAVGYKKHVDEEDEIAFNLSYIDDLGTLAGFQEELFGHESDDHGSDHVGLPTGSDERVPGWSVAAAIHYSGVAFSAEYMISQDRYAPGVLAFDGRGARPAAWSLEAGYGFELVGRGGELTLGYQGTSEAAGLGIPSIRYLSVVTVDLWKDTLFSTFEWIHDREYGTARGGSGENTNKYTLQLGLEF
ncbi:MAG: LbtU family siderophore porin [Gemmatimonadetes bacterium]|nr:LbtU family siderophore porin [Gemmatimonadota bacterium]MYG85721.1 LbtU family siderophore porin [Gemmatimonadota bacterium]MYJ90123.1 LbtU family siderophore porin [Gemmatimonadota bacterium]